METALNNPVSTVEELKAVKLEDGVTVEEKLVALIAKIGENMNIRRMEKVTTCLLYTSPSPRDS